MPAEPITFFFDFISPYAYLAWTQIHQLASRFGREVTPVPVLFAAFLDAHGHKGPAEIAPKRVYIFKDVVRTAHELGIPLSPPPAHPFNPLVALRCASLPESELGGAGNRVRLIDTLFAATWAGGPGVDDPGKLASLLTTAGFNGQELVSRAHGDEVKNELKQNTTRALALGVFGVPSMLVDSELFWGLDSFGHIARRLEGRDPIDQINLAQWANLPSASVRKASRS